MANDSGYFEKDIVDGSGGWQMLLVIPIKNWFSIMIDWSVVKNWFFD